MEKRIVTLGDFGWESAHEAVSRRPPISLDTIVARTGGYAYDVGVWDLSIVEGPFSVTPCQTLMSRFANFSPLYDASVKPWTFIHKFLYQFYRFKLFIPTY